jgi:hypothetical protein
MADADYFALIGLAVAIVIADIAIRWWQEMNNRNKK